MSKVKTVCTIKTYDDTKPDEITIASHWNVRDFVEITIDGKKVVVCGADIIRAVTNCQNVGI